MKSVYLLLHLVLSWILSSPFASALSLSLLSTIPHRRFLTLLLFWSVSCAAEVIYTAQPPYNVALIMSAAFVVGVFCFVTADLARIGIA